MPPPNPNLSALPLELLIDIFIDLDYFELVVTIGSVCRRFRSIINDPQAASYFKPLLFRQKYVPSEDDDKESSSPLMLNPAFADFQFKLKQEKNFKYNRQSLHIDNFTFKWSPSTETVAGLNNPIRKLIHNVGKKVNGRVYYPKTGRVAYSPIADENATSPPVDVLYFSYSRTHHRAYCKGSSSSISRPRRPPPIIVERDSSTGGALDRGVTVRQLLQTMLDIIPNDKNHGSYFRLPITTYPMGEFGDPFAKGSPKYIRLAKKVVLCDKCKGNGAFFGGEDIENVSFGS